MSNLANYNFKSLTTLFQKKKVVSSLYSTFFVNLYIVYELNTWPRNANYFKLKYCLFGTVKLTRNVDKSKFTYTGRGIAFYGKIY